MDKKLNVVNNRVNALSFTSQPPESIRPTPVRYGYSNFGAFGAHRGPLQKIKERRLQPGEQRERLGAAGGFCGGSHAGCNSEGFAGDTPASTGPGIIQTSAFFRHSSFELRHSWRFRAQNSATRSRHPRIARDAEALSVFQNIPVHQISIVLGPASGG